MLDAESYLHADRVCVQLQRFSQLPRKPAVFALRPNNGLQLPSSSHYLSTSLLLFCTHIRLSSHA